MLSDTNDQLMFEKDPLDGSTGSSFSSTRSLLIHTTIVGVEATNTLSGSMSNIGKVIDQPKQVLPGGHQQFYDNFPEEQNHNKFLSVPGHMSSTDCSSSSTYTSGIASINTGSSGRRTPSPYPPPTPSDSHDEGILLTSPSYSYRKFSNASSLNEYKPTKTHPAFANSKYMRFNSSSDTSEDDIGVFSLSPPIKTVTMSFTDPQLTTVTRKDGEALNLWIKQVNSNNEPTVVDNSLELKLSNPPENGCNEAHTSSDFVETPKKQIPLA